MASARENILPSPQSLVPSEYNIAGNDLRAYRDSENRLVFVIDFTTNPTLLIINPVDNRKWDDILSNDYGVDLETVRPKQDNKYQKLDIEYTGLDIYENLINAYNVDDDMEPYLAQLAQFRNDSARRNASERLANAEKVIANADDTIERANESIEQLNTQITQLRTKLTELRGEIGREPTKQSASKILRVESQIDVLTDKIARAHKRITNAQRRRDTAIDDANAAQKTLQNHNNFITQGDTMADDEVKPLFDTDPDIMDENIAFKPIDFNTNMVDETPRFEPDQPKQPAPLSFTPPVAKFEPESDDSDNVTASDVALDETFTTVPDIPEFPQEPEMHDERPVLNSITSVDEPVPDKASEPEPMFVPAQPAQPSENIATQRPYVSQPTRPTAYGVAPMASKVEQKTHGRPGVMYYILLIALIALSVFTLWKYQQAIKPNTTPDLVTQNIQAPKPDTKPETPTITTTPEQVAVPVYTEPEPVVAPEPVEVVAPKPIEIVPVLVEPEIVEPIITPVVEPVPEPKTEQPTVTEPIVNKPAYNVSQNEKMFISESEYNKQLQATTLDTTPEEAETCSDGLAPDQFGCCTGETYTDMGDGFACCAGDECFPPLL